MKTYTEKEVRTMRDKVYGQRSTDDNWLGSKDFWMKEEEIQWLEAMAQKIKA